MSLKLQNLPQLTHTVWHPFPGICNFVNALQKFQEHLQAHWILHVEHPIKLEQRINGFNEGRPSSADNLLTNDVETTEYSCVFPALNDQAWLVVCTCFRCIHFHRL